MTKIAAIQLCSSQSLDENLHTAQQFIEEAARHGAKLIVLPEMFATMTSSAQEKIFAKESFGNGTIQTFLSAQAKKNHVWLVGGTIPIATEIAEKIHAACLVYDDQGELKARYNKIHLFDVQLSQQESYQESATIMAGNQLTIFDSPIGRIGLAVCYDLRFPELFRCLFNQGAEIFIIPCAFTQPTGEAHFTVLTRSRAIENFCYVIAACQGGAHQTGRKTYGHSMVVEPWGKVIAEKTDLNPGVIYAEIDLLKVAEARKKIPIQQHQRIKIDSSL